MGVGLYLIGVLGKHEGDPLETAAQLFRDRYGDDLMRLEIYEDEGIVRVQLHPAADDLELRFGEQLVVSAKTSTVGPGYHADLCEAMHELATRLPITWAPRDENEGTGDGTGYFETRDRAALEAAMLQWLKTIITVVETGPGERIGVSMPMTPRYHGPPDAAVLTQLGPRDRAWLDAVKRDPRAGIDLFPWWEPGRGAAYELGRVMVHLWMDVRYRQAATDEETELGVELLERLRRAYRLDPTLAYPYTAWEMLQDEIIDSDDDELSQMVRERSYEIGGNTIGYRLYDIDVSLPGGWQITIPGAFAERLDDEGTWSAWEPFEMQATLWATSFSITRDGEPVPAERVLSTEPRKGTPTQIPEQPLLHRAHVSTFEEDGATWLRLATEIAADGNLLAIDAVVRDEADLPWARRVLATVKR